MYTVAVGEDAGYDIPEGAPEEYIVSCSQDGTVRHWSVRSGAQVQARVGLGAGLDVLIQRRGTELCFVHEGGAKFT